MDNNNLKNDNLIDRLNSIMEKINEVEKPDFDENGKVLSFSKENVRQISTDLITEFRQLALEKYGIKVKFGNIKFNEVMFSTKIEFNIVSDNGIPKISNADKIKLNHHALYDNLIKEGEEMYGKKYIIKKDSVILIVIGYCTRRSKKPYTVFYNGKFAACNAAYLKNCCTPIEEIESI